MSDKDPVTNVVVTLSDDADLDVEEVTEALRALGLSNVKHLQIVNCLLATFAGDTKKLASMQDRLRAVKGVVTVEPEETMSSQG